MRCSQDATFFPVACTHRKKSWISLYNFLWRHALFLLCQYIGVSNNSVFIHHWRTLFFRYPYFVLGTSCHPSTECAVLRMAGSLLGGLVVSEDAVFAVCNFLWGGLQTPEQNLDFTATLSVDVDQITLPAHTFVVKVHALVFQACYPWHHFHVSMQKRNVIVSWAHDSCSIHLWKSFSGRMFNLRRKDI